MKNYFFHCVLTILFILCSLAVYSQDESHPITIHDIINLKTVGKPEISPDGKWVAYTVSEVNLEKDKSVSRIYIIPSSGGEAIPITSNDYSARQPKWSSNNKFLSFLTAKNEDEKTQVWTSNRMGGDAEKLTNIPQGVSGHEWSPVDNRLLLSITDPKPEDLTKDKEDDKKAKPYVIDRLQFKQDYEGYLNNYRTHLYIFNPGDTAAIQLTFGEYDDSDPQWSPDGKTIAFVSNRSLNPDGNANSDIWLVSSLPSNQGKDIVQLTKNPNEDDSPSWSPDGKSIVYKTVTDGDAIWYATQKLAMISTSGNNSQILTESLDRNISGPQFSENGESIFFMIEENGSSNLANINLKSKKIERTIQGDLSVAAYELKNSKIIALVGKANRPTNLYVFDNGTLNELTGVNDDLMAKIKKPLIEKIQFQSADGTDIEGFVVKPIDFDASKKYPAVLWIHGGPTSQYDFSFDTEPQLFAANGFVTLLINPRGSTGYGQEFSEAIFADWGNKDFQDVIAGVDFVIHEGYVNKDKLVVGGWSYGGILTNYVITKSDRFKAAMSGASEALYRSNYGHDHYQLTWEKELGLPWENAEAWERISPFNDVAKITTPTLWMGGSEDWNVPILNSEQMYQAMKRLGRDTQLVVYPGESHGLKRPSFIKDRLERYLDWFNKHLE